MKTSQYFLILLCLGILISCQEKDPEPDAMMPPTGCDGDLTGTDCQQFFVPAGEILSFPAGTEIKASDGIEINGDIVIDPSAGGDFTITAIEGDIVIAGRIMVKDTADGNPSGGRYKRGKSTSRLKNGKAADGFTLTLDARGVNGNIILKKGATLFSGRGQYAPDEHLTSLSGYYEGAAGGNGGLIILNAPNGKVQLPDLGNTVTQIKDEVFVLGNGGHGANIELDANLETGDLDIVEVRGGLGGNAGQLIIDTNEIEGMPALEAVETHPDFIHGGEGGKGGNVAWSNAGSDKKYALQEVILHGGDGGDGAVYGGNGGVAFFTSSFNPMSEVGDPVPNIFCYGGHGGDVFPSPLPQSEVWGGDGGSYAANGVRGWDGGEDKEGNLIRDGADGGDALGQGGNGGNILEGVSAYEAIGGSGGHGEEAQTDFPRIFGSQLSYLSGTFGVAAGNGGDGYADCNGCRGGNGGNAGIAKAFGGKGGDVLGEAIRSIGGTGGNTWAVSRGIPGNGGDGNPPGNAGTQPSGGYLYEFYGEGGNGTTPGNAGALLGNDLNKDLAISHDGETCGEDLECEREIACDTVEIDAICNLWTITKNTDFQYANGASRHERYTSIGHRAEEDGSAIFYHEWELTYWNVDQNGISSRVETLQSNGPEVFNNELIRTYFLPWCVPDRAGEGGGNWFNWWPDGRTSHSSSSMDAQGNQTEVVITISCNPILSELSRDDYFCDFGGDPCSQ